MGARILTRRRCPCGCETFFDVTTRSPHQVCVNRQHAKRYQAKRGGYEDTRLESRREKFREMLRALAVPGQPVKEAALIGACEEAWKLGYYAGHRVGGGAPARRSKRQARSAEAA